MEEPRNQEMAQTNSEKPFNEENSEELMDLNENSPQLDTSNSKLSNRSSKMPGENLAKSNINSTNDISDTLKSLGEENWTSTKSDFEESSFSKTSSAFFDESKSSDLSLDDVDMLTEKSSTKAPLPTIDQVLNGNAISNNSADDLWNDDIPTSLIPGLDSQIKPNGKSSENSISLENLKQMYEKQKSLFTTQVSELQRLVANQKALQARIKKPLEDKASKTLEKKLADLINSEGGVSSIEDMIEFSKLLAQEKSDKGRLLLIGAIVSTKETILKRFVEGPGFKTLDTYLTQYTKENKGGVLKVTLKALLKLPVTKAALAGSDIAKRVKALSKSHPDADIQQLATSIVKTWLTRIADQEKSAKKPAVVATPTPAPTSASTAPTPIDSPKMKKAADIKPAGKKTAEAPAKKPVAPTPPVQPAPVKKRPLLSHNMDDILAIDSSKPAPKQPKVQAPETKANKEKHKMKLEEAPVVKKAPLTKPTYQSKPLSADDIRKQKFKEKVLSEPEGAKEPPLKKPRGETDEMSTEETKVSSPPSTTVPVVNEAISGETQQQKLSIEIPTEISTGSPRSPIEISKGEGEEDKMDTTWVVDHNTNNNINIDEKEFPALESPRGISKKTKKPKKKLSWAPDSQLKAVREYTKEETITPGLAEAPVKFEEARLHEHQLERERLQKLAMEKRRLEEEHKQKVKESVKMIPWRVPPEVEVSDAFVTARGSESKQAPLQVSRETRELMAVYLNEGSIPLNPEEPPLEPEYDDSKTTIIPFEESKAETPVAMPLPTPAPAPMAPMMGFNPNLPPQLNLPLLNPQLLASLLTVTGGNPQAANPDLIQTLLKLNSGLPGMGMPFPMGVPGMPNNVPNLMFPFPQPMNQPPPQNMPQQPPPRFQPDDQRQDSKDRYYRDRDRERDRERDDDKRFTKECSFYKRGMCRNGDKCRFLHID